MKGPLIQIRKSVLRKPLLIYLQSLSIENWKEKISQHHHDMKTFCLEDQIVSIEAIVFCFHHFVLSQCFERMQALLKVKPKVTESNKLGLFNW